MESWIEQPANLVMAGMLFILFVWLLVLQVRTGKLRKRYLAVMNGASPANMEQVLIEAQQRLEKQEEQIRALERKHAELSDKVARQKGNSALKRFNAFSETGSDLSFSFAMLNDDRDGVVISGIHHREECYIYAKPVANGESTYKLTPEEEEVIRQAAKFG